MISRCVSPACELRELCCAVVLQEDIPWEWEQIFTEVSSELLTEWELQEAPEEWTSAGVAARHHAPIKPTEMISALNSHDTQRPRLSNYD